MASEPFTIQFESFDGGLSQGPYTGADNQYTWNRYMDTWTEPGTLQSIGFLEEFSPTSNASYKTAILSIIRSSTSNNKYPVIVATNASWTLATAMMSETDGTLTPLARFDTYNLTAPSIIGRYNQPLVEFNNDLFTASGLNTIQHTAFATSSSFVTQATSGMQVTDIIENFGYLYVSKIAGTNSSPGYIARFDTTNGSLITNGGTVFYEPAVQLAAGWGPTCMANFGDYIAISALKTGQHDMLDWSLRGSSRLYIWDGISNNFDKKVDIPGAAVTAIHTHLGQLYLFASTPGGIDILRYAGGDVVQKVARISTAYGNSVDTNGEDTNVPWVRKQSISSHGTKMYIGTMVNGGDAAQGNLYAFDSQTGVVDMVDRFSKLGTHTVFFNNEIRMASEQRASNSSPVYFMGNVPFQNGEAYITTTTRFAPAGKKMRIKRVLVRHAYLPGSSDTIGVRLNYNLTELPRSTAPGTSILSASGSSLNTPGIGDNAAYEHVYTFQQADGTPMPLIDSFNLGLSMTSDQSTYHRTRVFLPIVVEGELIDSPN